MAKLYNIALENASFIDKIKNIYYDLKVGLGDLNSIKNAIQHLKNEINKLNNIKERKITDDIPKSLIKAFGFDSKINSQLLETLVKHHNLLLEYNEYLVIDKTLDYILGLNLNKEKINYETIKKIEIENHPKNPDLVLVTGKTLIYNLAGNYNFGQIDIRSDCELYISNKNKLSHLCQLVIDSIEKTNNHYKNELILLNNLPLKFQKANELLTKLSDEKSENLESLLYNLEKWFYKWDKITSRHFDMNTLLYKEIYEYIKVCVK